MKNPFHTIRKNREKAVAKWAAQSFAGGGTFRMFAERHTKRIRKFLRREVRGCSELVRAKDADDYTKRLIGLVRRFQDDRIRLNRQSKRKYATFGQAAKVINLYIKQFLLRPDFMGRYPKQRIYRWAHVPLDRLVLRHMWKDFRGPMKKAGFTREPRMHELEEEQYKKLQAILRQAKRHGLPPLAYDFRWADRKER